MPTPYKSWGYTPKEKQAGFAPTWRHQLDLQGNTSSLPFGNGRSYGDSCLNSLGRVIDTRNLNHFIDFDQQNGLLTCESGVKFSDIIRVCGPKGWFLPVTPGTRFVTVGGAIANDVHGKNHHVSGTFGKHVVQFELKRSDGSNTLCSADQNNDLFKSTIGGLGLTGLISWAQFQLIPISSDKIDVWSVSFNGLEEFYELSATHSQAYDYSVAWLDCSATGNAFGRGIFLAGNHHQAPQANEKIPLNLPDPSLSVPIHFPALTLNKYTVRAFNALYYRRHKREKHFQDDLHKYFYPLDNIYGWNKIYGRKGFYQYQFCVPTDRKQDLESILSIIAREGAASFLAVLKEFGDVSSPGMLSFPMPGYCLALDFPDHGQSTVTLLAKINTIVQEAGGRVYPAKDRLMDAQSFQTYYPAYTNFKQFIDPGMSSDFWRRVMPNE